MDSLIKIFPAGSGMLSMPHGCLFKYGSDGSVFLHPDGFVSGDKYALKKLAFVFDRKDVPFIKLGNGLLLIRDLICG